MAAPTDGAFREPAASPACVTFPSEDWPIARVAGADRFATAACAARAGYADGADTVVLARGDAAGDYADALAGTVLARAEDAPVLLTGPTSLAAPTRDAIVALGATRVLVLGGPVAISDRVVDEVERLVDDVDRIAGDTRAGTAAAIAARVPGEGAFVVNGRRPADALTAGAAAARAGDALLLVEPDGIPAETPHGTGRPQPGDHRRWSRRGQRRRRALPASPGRRGTSGGWAGRPVTRRPPPSRGCTPATAPSTWSPAPTTTSSTRSRPAGSPPPPGVDR